MVVAKSEQAYSHLKRAFKERTVDKRYSALVQGHPDPTSGTIDAPIGRHPGADYKFAVVEGGRPSVTHYVTEEAFRAATLLDVHLETGRTHQIRVHMAAVRHPCVGDTTYGADPTLAARLGLHRQWLHARELGVRAPRHRGANCVSRHRCRPICSMRWTSCAPSRDGPARLAGLVSGTRSRVGQCL